MIKENGELLKTFNRLYAEADEETRNLILINYIILLSNAICKVDITNRSLEASIDLMKKLNRLKDEE